MELVDQLRRKFDLLRPVMDERMTRLWAAAEAIALGYGGEALVTQATGIRGKRIWKGKQDLGAIEERPPEVPPQDQRIRRPGAGRKRLTETDTDLLAHLETLIDPVTRGDPESSLRWTTKSTEKLASELRSLGHKVGKKTVGRLLKKLGYSLQALRKTKEGSQHPDRNRQFEHIAKTTKAFQAAGLPVISVDTKKKELVGDFKNGGREWQPKGEPEAVRVHDFIDPQLGKAIPYGVYDTTRNEAWVSVGIDHDTAAFAVDTIDQWWKSMGRRAYPGAPEILVLADGGGSNSSRSRLWKKSLQAFADRTGLTVHVSHLPPGTSKWNKIEHRLFSHVGMNWRGRPLVSHDTVVQLISATTTTAGLKVKAKLNTKTYPTGIKVTDDEMGGLNLARGLFHGDWNYAVAPRQL